ncbi:MAG: serine hydrolase domain-containing protein [Lachnospiraceae bacterium]|jgi:CubicO group peptidase (beta-lactamase class C family)
MFELLNGELAENGLDEALIHSIDDFITMNRYRLMRSVLIVKNQKVVYEWYGDKCNRSTRHELHSVEKSVTSTAIGICLKNNLIRSLDIPITEIFPEYFNDEANVFHKLITLKTLLTMTSGFYWRDGPHLNDPMREQLKRSKDWLQVVADCDVVDVPNTEFKYKITDIYLLNACIERLTGKTVYDILNEYMFPYVGIKCEPFIITPSSSVYRDLCCVKNCIELSAIDLAKFGLLYLNHGKLNNQQIISAEYVDEATAAHIQNYGYYWWINEDGSGYRGLGRGGQELHVYPEFDMVVVLQAQDSPRSKFYTPIITDVILKAIK